MTKKQNSKNNAPLKIKKSNSLQWVFEPLESNPAFTQKRMFGCLAGYLVDRIVLVVADKEEPWNGLLIPTEREFHPLLQTEFSALVPHPILGKWLYISQGNPSFEETAAKIIKLILAGNPRIGVLPKLKKKRRKI